MEKVRIGLIGLGFMGSTHFRIYEAMENAVVVALADVEEDKRRIELSMTQQGPCLSISVQNSAAGKVQVEGNTVRTTKEQKELHGFGLNSVREIAEKYRGSCTIQSTEDEFTVYIILQEG